MPSATTPQFRTTRRASPAGGLSYAFTQGEVRGKRHCGAAGKPLRRARSQFGEVAQLGNSFGLISSADAVFRISRVPPGKDRILLRHPELALPPGLIADWISASRSHGCLADESARRICRALRFAAGRRSSVGRAGPPLHIVNAGKGRSRAPQRGRTV
jgi:hypothetical protein